MLKRFPICTVILFILKKRMHSFIKFIITWYLWTLPVFCLPNIIWICHHFPCAVIQCGGGESKPWGPATYSYCLVISILIRTIVFTGIESHCFVYLSPCCILWFIKKCQTTRHFGLTYYIIYQLKGKKLSRILKRQMLCLLSIITFH